MSLIHSWLNPKLELRNSGGGTYRGICVKENVRFGELLAISGGHVMSVIEEPIFSDGTKDLAIMINEDFVIGSKYESEIEDTDFFNHSCNPNAGIKGQVFLVAMRDIEADEEVTFDYAMVICESSGKLEGYEFNCLCGSANCRGKVTGKDWMIPELQMRYDGFFSWYLQEKIDKLKVLDGSKRNKK